MRTPWALVPWIWTAVTLNLGSVALLFGHGRTDDVRWLDAACAAAFAGVWIEKGMGLIVPGFIPRPCTSWSSTSPA